MCGIAGIYEGVERASRRVLQEMAGELRHRGPDGVGLYLDRRFGMVNTRLAIVDIAGGDQPLPNETGRFWVMQNGEIYNAAELTDELKSLGHRFETRCDTEVLVHAYEQWGEKCLDRLNGAFAFAIWDHRNQELFLARDRLGIRPLFVAEYGSTLVFASEAKAILRHPDSTRAIDPLGLVETFTTWATGPDRSALTGVRELPPGHFLRAGVDGNRQEHRWWYPKFVVDDRKRSESDMVDELVELLDDSTRLRLRADVTVGAYLSGGLDSSITAAIVRRVSCTSLRSFAVRFDDALFDEGVYQKRVADQLATHHESIQIGPSHIAASFPEVVRLAEKPLLRTAAAPLFRLSDAVNRSGIKVVLTGEGADEVFAGYNIFREDKVRRFWARQPESRFRPLLLRQLYPYLAKDLGRTGGFLRAFFAKGLSDTHDPLYSHRIRFENTRRITRLLDSDLIDRAAAAGDPTERLINRLPVDFGRFSPLGRAQYLETVTFLQGYLLHSQGDRMLMGNSIEGRFPFLDHRVVEFAAALPDRMRLRGMREKYLLRRAAARLLPPDVVNRPKHPYRAPILRVFFGRNAPDYVSELLSIESLVQAGLFDSGRVQKLVRKCERSFDSGVSETDEMALVGVLSTMLLHREFIANPRSVAVAEPNRIVIGNSVIDPHRHRSDARARRLSNCI